MKVHVVNKEEDHIKGYEQVEITDQGLNLDKYSDNECSFILASDCLDLLSYENIQNSIVAMRKKMRIGSTLVIGGTDIRIFARAIINESIDLPTANTMLCDKKSFSDVNSISDMLSGLGLTIVTTKISGVHYEIEASR